MKPVCTKCGFENPPGMRFCGNCGARLGSDKHPEPQLESNSTEMVDATRPPAIDPEKLGILTGTDLLDRFRKAGLEASGQRRNVTVLFVDLSNFTHLSTQLTDEELYGLVQRYIGVMVHDVYKYEGIVDKLTGDGVMALFGAPISHENNAERAVRSALDMVADVERLSREIALPGLELKVHIGIHSGSVIVGGVGGDGLMNYTAIGDSVNLARRLEENAQPGQILVSENVFLRTSRLFQFRKLPLLKLKNIPQPVPAYQVLSVKLNTASMRGVEGLHAPLVGREEEFTKITQTIDRLVSTKTGGAILLEGEGGMGKSRLTEEVKAALDSGQLTVVEGQSLTYRKSLAFWILQGVLRNYLGVSADTPVSTIRQRLSNALYAVLGEKAGLRLPYLEHLMALQTSDSAFQEKIQYLDAGQLRQQVFIALRDFLVGLSRHKPLLIILEDLHWADEASIEFIRFMIDFLRSSPIIIYGITRPYEGGVMEEIDNRAQRRLGKQYLHLRLQALPPSQSERLLQALLPIQNFPTRLLQQIIERSAGLPFYLEEIIRMLIEQKILVQIDGNWRVMPGTDLDVVGMPDSLQGLILSRIDRLTLPQRRVLQAASVIGFRFTSRLLTEVMLGEGESLQPGDINTILNFLRAREFIIPNSIAKGETDLRSENNDIHYQFRHVLVSDAVYGTLLQRDRRDLHLRAGQAIERLYPDQIDRYIEVLAGHFLRSPNQDRALHYLLLAGQRAARSYANGQALQLFRQAMEILPNVAHSPEQEMAVHSGLGDSLLTAGDYTSAREHYIEALESLGIPGKTGALSTPPAIKGKRTLKPDEYISILSNLQRKIARTLESQGDYDKALVYLRSAQMVLRGAESKFTVEQSNCLNDTGWVYFRRGSLDQAESVLLAGLQIAESHGIQDVTASILNRLAGISFQRDLIDQAFGFMNKSLQIREQIGDVVGVARSYNNLGLLCWKQGLLQSALDNFHHSYNLQTNLGDVEGQIVLQTNMGLIEMDSGNLSEALQYFQEALENAKQIGHSYHVCMTQMHLALLNVYAENWPAVVHYGKLSIAGFEKLGVHENLVDINVSLGCAYLALADEAHLMKIEQAVADMVRSEGGVNPPPESHGRAYRLFGRIAVTRGELEQAAESLARSVEIFNLAGNNLERSRSLVDLGKVYLAQGQLERAKALFSDAKDVFKKMGAQLEFSCLEKIEEGLKTGL